MPLRTVSQNLTAAQTRVLGFETPATDWSAGNGSVSASTDVTQGAASLRIAINGYTQISSVNMPAPGSARAQATLDLKLGSQVGWGEARLVAVIPSQGKYWSDLGGVPLAGLPAGAFRNISFNVPADVQAALNGTATDVSFRVILNAPSGTTFTLDNLEVSDEGTSDPEVGTTDSVEFSLAVPAGSAISDFVISGTNKVTVDDRSTISAPGAGSKIGSLGAGRLELGAAVKAYADVVSVGDVDFLRSHAHVYGEILTAGTVLQQNNVVVDGGITTGAAVTPAVTTWTVEWPSGPASDVSLAPDTPTIRLEPGNYDSIKGFSRSGIILESGAYFINSFEIEPQVKLYADVSRGPIQIYVRDAMFLRSSLLYFGGKAGQVLIGYLGNQTALFEEAVNASVVAPNSVIELRRPNSGAPHRGSFFGEEVHVFSDATVLHVPASIDFVCPSGDFDKDGVLNCSEECWRDPAKVSEGVCGCGTPDVDTDGDEIFDCDDDCPLDPEVSTRGMCGCPSDPDVAPEGTACNDGVVAGTFTCNGAGACGDPSGTEIEPEPGCELKTIGSTGYFICPGGGGGGGGPTRPATPGDPTGAAALCAKTPGGRLVQIESQKKNAEVASLVDGRAWIGAADFTTEGDWYWRGRDGSEKTQFWFGGHDGASAKGAFTSWASKTPVTDHTKNCATIDENGQWSATDCSELHAYVCEFSFKRIGTGYIFPDPKGPAEIIPGYPLPEDEAGNPYLPENYPVFDPGDDELPECDVDYSSDVWTFRQQGYDSSKECEEECGAGADLTDEEKEQCQAEFCSGSASVPDANSICTDDRQPLRELDVIFPGTCEVPDLADLVDEDGDPLPEDQQIAALQAAQDCSDAPLAAGVPGILPARCGVQTVCLDLNADGQAQRCGEPGMTPCPTGECGCPKGGDCLDDNGDPEPKFCLDSSVANACQSQVNHNDSNITQGPSIDRVDGNNVCAGQCFSRVGCGYNLEELQAALNPDEIVRCDETQICAGPEFVDDDIAATFTEPEEPVIGAEEPEEEEDDTPYPSDFENPCDGKLADCTDPCFEGCDVREATRHPWCTDNPRTEGDQPGSFLDERSGQQGAEGAPLKFTLEPISDLNFNLTPLPNGAANFEARAAAGVRAAIDFDLLGTTGSVEVVDLKAQISANICRVTTKDSKLEVVGVDFLPQIASAAIFDSDEVLADENAGEDDPKFSETCEEAVSAYLDAFDRAKKALRDAQTLLTQYKEKEALGQTFGPDFCEQVAGPGTRPPGMKGACPQQPHEVINNFVEYYEDQVAALPQAVRDLEDAVLNGDNLGDAISGAASRSPYQFFVNLGVAEEESVTLVALQFFIGPIPCLLEISSYVDYGIAGGFGAKLDPRRLIGGSGNFAQVGAEVGPYANSGITLFVGAGFNVGPLELSVGVEGGVTLGHITLPAVVSAGLNLERKSERNRLLPADLVALTNTDQAPVQLFPTESTLQKYSYKFNYEYGVGFQVTDILTGYLNGRMKVKFAFFSKKFSQRIATFKSNISVGPIMLIRGEGPGGLEEEEEIGGSDDYEGEIAQDVTYWKQSLETVPFLQLARLSLPQADLDEVATLDMSAVREFFYDELCVPPVETGGECGRDADCETEGDVCVPNGQGVTVCGPPLCLPSGSACTVNSECCGGESCLLNLNGSRTCGQPGCTRAVGQSCLEPDEPTSACCAGSFVDCATSVGISGTCVEVVR